MINREKGSTRPMILRPGAKKAEAYLRASEVAKLVEDKYGLNIWQQNRIGWVVATNEKIRAEWATLDPDVKDNFWPLKDLREKTIRAHTAGKPWNRGAGVAGTKFHSVTDKNDNDSLFDAGDFADDLAVYQNVIRKIGPVIASERFVVNDELGIGGTFDKLIDCKIADPDGNILPCIADLKTGKVDKKELEFAMQMAVYANSVYYDNGERTPYLVNRKWAMIIHLPLGSNEANVIWVDIAAAFRIVEAAILVKETRKIKTVHALTVNGPTLEEKIALASSPRELVQLYKDNRDIWLDHHNELASARSLEWREDG